MLSRLSTNSDLFNQWGAAVLAAIYRALGVGSDKGGPVTVKAGEHGTTVAVTGLTTEYVQLTTASSGTRVYATAGGGWATLPYPPPGSGAMSSLIGVGNPLNTPGTVVEVQPLTGEGTGVRWWYDYPRACASVCFTLLDSGSSPIAGASITLTPDSGPTVTGMTDAGGIWCPGGLAAGYWYADVDLGTSDPNPARITLKLADACCCSYTLTWTDGVDKATPAACCKCDTTLNVNAQGLCGHGHLSGVLVTVTGPGGYTASQTTDGSSNGVTFILPHVGGDYTVTGVWNGAQTKTATVAVTACNSYSTTLYYWDTPQVQVVGCNGPISGARVVCGPVRCTTDGTGFCTLDFSHDVPPPDPAPITVTLPTGPRRTQVAGTGVGSINPFNCLTIFNFIDNFCVNVTGCNTTPAVTAAVAISGPEDFSGVTDSNGRVCFTPTVDWQNTTLQVTISKPYYTTLVWTYAVPANVDYPCEINLGLTPIDCYICCPNCVDPTPSQITITDANGIHTALVVRTPGACTAAVCYEAPSSNAVDHTCHTVTTVMVRYVFDITYFQNIASQHTRLTLFWAAWDCSPDMVHPAQWHAMDTTCDVLARGIGGLGNPFVDSVQVVWSQPCPSLPLNLSGTIPADFTGTNPLAGSAVTVAGACTNGPGPGPPNYVYYYQQQGGSDGLPSSVTITFDGNPVWGSLAGTTVTLPRNGTTGDYESSCLTTTTDGGNCDPTAATEGLLTVSLSLSSPGLVDATVQWTGGTHGSGCADGTCEYYGSASGTGIPEDDSPTTLTFGAMTYSAGGSGTFIPPSTVAQHWDGVTAPALPTGWTYSGTGWKTATAGGAGQTPLSSPNMLTLPSGIGYAYPTAADTSGGNVTVSAAFASDSVGVVATPTSALVFGRGTLPTSGSRSYYFADIDFTNGAVGLGVYVGGAFTSLGNLTGVTLATTTWYTLELTCSETSISAAVQRQSDGYWLQPGGGWAAAATACLDAVDGSLTGSGLAGLELSAGQLAGGADAAIYIDDFALSSTGATVTLKVPAP